MKKLKFHRSFGIYQSGDVASFDDLAAGAILGMDPSVAVAENDDEDQTKGIDTPPADKMVRSGKARTK